MGKNEQLSMEKFRIYLQMKDDKKAFQEIESLVQEYPMDMRYQVILGDVYLQNGKKQEAYDVYQKVLAAEPDNPMAIFSMASYYKQTGQEGLYQQQLDTLLLNKKVTPDTKVSVMRQMIVENEQADKDSTQIIALFDRIMKQEQDDPQIPMLYAQYLLSKNMEAESVPVLEQVVDLDPTNKAARMMLVGTAVRKRITSRSLRFASRVLKRLRMRWNFIIIWPLPIIRQNSRIVWSVFVREHWNIRQLTARRRSSQTSILFG